MPPPATSVVVVSRHRPADLALCLGALALQDHPAMEVVLVADPAGLAVRPDLPVKRVAFDQANISAARNLGIAAAAGAVVAFIDDDAVAEPTWARRLAEVFADAAVIAASGWTKGPFGRSWQSQGELIGCDGPYALPLMNANPHSLPAKVMFSPKAGVLLGPLGTNCAFRRSALAAVGGFDPAFAYHRDESDLAMRLAARFPDAVSALVPPAEVTHGSAPSDRRGEARVPRSLTGIGRSEAQFAARFGGDPGLIEPRQRRSLIAHMLAGRLEPFAVAPLLDSLRQGIAAGSSPQDEPSPMTATAWSDPAAFLPMPVRDRDAVVLSGRWSRRRRLRAEAAARVAEGCVVTLILRIPGLMPHRTRFTPGGWWEQIGGGFGPSAPGDPALLPMSWSRRVEREAIRLRSVRLPIQQAPIA